MDKVIHPPLYLADSWAPLKQFTQARIALGRTGNSIPTKQLLELNLAHANARDAVYAQLDIDNLHRQLEIFKLPILHLQSLATNRNQYLQRPDLGRKLHPLSAEQIIAGQYPVDVAIIIADGLSASGINQHVVPLINELIPLILNANLTIGPLCLAEQARVAIGDDIGFALEAKMSIILIGERPGLSAADSVGAYLTYQPRPGLTDEARNCISNIRPGGLSVDMAAEKIYYLLQEGLKRRISGVALKEETIKIIPGDMRTER